MNFFELCKATARESGTVAGLPSFVTVTDATGRVDKLVNWVRDAWRDIQNERIDWLFRISTFSHALTIGQATYSGSELGITDFGRFLPDSSEQRIMSLYDATIGRADEGSIQQISYPAWRQRYDMGSHDNNRPTEWAMSPDGKLCLGNTPDKAYVLRGQYRRKAQMLTADADEPIMPEDFHGLIVGEALRLMAESDEAFQVLAQKAQKYERLRAPLVIDQTPEIYTMQGDPLA